MHLQNHLGTIELLQQHLTERSFRVMERGLDRLLGIKSKKVWDRRRVEPQASRTNKHQAIQPIRRKRSNFSRQHPAHRMTNDMGIVDLQLIKEVEVVQGKVNDVIEVFDPLARAKPGMGRGVDGEVFGQFVKERGSNHRPASSVQEEEWRSAPPPLHRGGELPVPYGYSQFLHATSP